MKKDLTDITVVLDRSGSMDIIKNDTIGGFNQFLDEQKKTPGSARITLVQFSDKNEKIYEDKLIQEAPVLNDQVYKTSGSTALLDALGKTINETGVRLSNIEEDERPDKVVFLIITDGEENASREFTQNQISEKIKHQTEVYNWQFVYIGANQDSFSVSSNIGIRASSTMNWCSSSEGTKSMYTKLSSTLNAYRSSDSTKDFFKS